MAEQRKSAVESEKGVMSGKELRVLERIVRNLPITKPQFFKTESRYGIIYLAYGKRDDGGYTGVWGCRGVARDVEFYPNVTIKTIRAQLIDDCHWMMAHMQQRGMLDDGFWQADLSPTA